MTTPTLILVPCVAVVLLLAMLLIARLMDGWVRSRGSEKSQLGDPDVAALKTERDRTLATLSDLQHEYDMGKLSEADHQDLKAFYEQEAVRLLEALEGAE